MARKWLSVLLIMCLVVGVMMPAALADDSNETFIVVTNEDPRASTPMLRLTTMAGPSSRTSSTACSS